MNQILEFSVAELDTVKRDEVLNYKLYLPFTTGNFNFSTELKSITGEAALVVKRCTTENENCQVTL